MKKVKETTKKHVSNMKYYVLWHNFNQDKIERFNIFNNGYLIDGVSELLENYTEFNQFKIDLDSLLMYCFWSKAEYEILCKGWVSKNNNSYKIDVYYQIEQNLDILARYIIDEWNNRPYARKGKNNER